MYFLSALATENLVSRDGFGRPGPRQPLVLHTRADSVVAVYIYIYIYIISFNATYSRWTSSLPSCLWSQRIFPSLPGLRLTIFYRDASSALLQLVNQWLSTVSILYIADVSSRFVRVTKKIHLVF